MASLRRRGRNATRADDPIHFLNAEERAHLARLERSGIAKATLAGALSALATVAATLFAVPFEKNLVVYWSIVGGITVLASLVELVVLYIDGVHTVAAMARAAGLEMSEGAINESIALGLARAAFELPSPPESQLGVNAHQESSRFALAMASLLYKLKVTITNFVLKLALRRVLGRAVGVSLLFVAVPVTAVWNGIVAFRIFREARLRIVGSTSAPVLAEFIGASAEEGELALRAIGCVTVQSARVHPSVEALAEALIASHPRVEPHPSLGDRKELLFRLGEASASERTVALRAAVAAAILDGKITRGEERLLADLAALVPLALPREEIRFLSSNLANGTGIEEARLAALALRLSVEENRVQAGGETAPLAS